MSEDDTLVFRESVDRDQVVAFARRLGWTASGDVQRGHFVLASERFTTSDGTTIEYLEDHTGDVRFVQLSGPSQRSVAAVMRESLPCYDASELLRALPESKEPIEWLRGLSRLAVYRPKHTNTLYLSLWSRALNHADVSVRRAAIRTTYGCTWPELLPLVIGRIAVEREIKRPLQALARHLKSVATGAATTRPSA
ncbi:MAG: hypothetical protein KUG77_12465 [Nannocystaceae bacterium]|nr:hypothetical protein [Nannocystaceae bacterium]